MTDSPQLRLERVSLITSLGDNYLLKEISFEVNRGDCIAILGPSGAGKTSLLRLVNRLSEPTQGEIYFREENLSQIPVLQLRQQVTLVLQESKLLEMTVQEALAYPLQLRHLSKTAIQQQISYWIDKLHLPLEWLERTEVQLSVGQRQWVAIARALVIQPQILLLDEPTSALDAGRAQLLADILKELRQEQHMSILIVSHQWEWVQKFCTRTLYMHHGTLLQDTSVAQTNWSKLRAMLSQAEDQEDEWS
jgi:D-methionine transport system ATP-binding protein